jgi:hypothetical protein
MFSPQLPVPADLGLPAVLVISGHQPEWCIRGRTPYACRPLADALVVRMLRLALLSGNYEIDGRR